MKKKILFTAYSMDIGGIEKALLSLLKSLDYSKYDITLILQHKRGVFLPEIPQNIKVIEYKISNNKNVILRKLFNRSKLLLWILKNYKKYDFAGCFTTSCIPSSILARFLGKKSAFWVHANYLDLYDGDYNKVKTFFDERNISKFNKIIFVSNESRLTFIKQFNNLEDKCITCNNIIDYQEIIDKSKIKANIKKPKDTTIFLNVSRHEEHQKRLSRLIESSKLLLKDKYNFEVWLIGDGPDHEKYKELVKKNKLEKNIKFLGPQKNPYPYYKNADAFVLTSYYEGFPVVYIESLIFNLPIITTVYVTDNVIDIKDYGVIMDNDDKSIYLAMKEFVDKGYDITNKFDAEKFNKEIMKSLEKIID